MGAKAAEVAGFAKTSAVEPPEGASDRSYGILPLWSPTEGGRGKAFVDFQSDVTAKDVKIAHQEGYQSVEHLKRYTTLGMGTDQGKTSNINALALMAEQRGIPIPEAGTTTFRPPYAPLTIGAIAGRSVGAHFRPRRLSPLHDWHVANGATFIEAGPWMRAWYYAWAGSAPETAYVKEMELVRKGVGLADVSTLGKIDVQGPDAAEFLNRVYVNGFAKLPVGKVRYGVMLNDDGVVLDDGTTARISETQFYMTTTTAQAGEVMSWLEYLLQCHWTDLNVQVASLTDEWAGMAVSGPKSRAALELAFPGVDVSDAALPHMGCRDIAFDGVTVRLLRMSFSGELAYEVHVAAGYAIACGSTSSRAPRPSASGPMGSRLWRRCASRRAMWPGSSSITATRWTIWASARWRARTRPMSARRSASARSCRRPSAGASWASNSWSRTRNCAAARSSLPRPTRSRAMAAATSPPSPGRRN